MCRWLVYQGEKKVVLADLITRPTHSLIRQSYEHYLPSLCASEDAQHLKQSNHHLNGDGFGVGWYDVDQDSKDSLPSVFTSVTPAWNNRNLHSLSERISSKCVFSHVRAATPGSVISENNCHPFQFGRFLFMHNGAVASFPRVKRSIINKISDDTLNMIKGTTDTEYAAALFVHHLPDGPNRTYHPSVIKQALLDTISDIIQMSKDCATPECPPKPSSLNFAVTDGQTVICTRYRNDTIREPPSLYYSTTVDMRCVGEESARDESSSPTTQKLSCSYYCIPKKQQCSTLPNSISKKCIISSEPITFSEEHWQLVPKNSMIIITPDTEAIIEAIPDDISSVNLCEATHSFVCEDLVKEVESMVHSSEHDVILRQQDSKLDLNLKQPPTIKYNTEKKPHNNCTQISIQLTLNVERGFWLFLFVSAMVLLFSFLVKPI